MQKYDRFTSEMLARLPFSTNVMELLAKLNPKYEIFNDISRTTEERLLDQSVVNYQPNLRRRNSLIGEIGKTMDFYEYMYATLDKDKVKRLQDYRRMSAYPEMANALDEICDECIVYNEGQDDIINFELMGEYSRDIKKDINKEWKKFAKYYKLEERGWEYFRSFLIDGELFFENIISKNRPDYGILGVVQIPTELINPIYDNVQNGIIKGFALRKSILSDNGKTVDKEVVINLDTDQVTYIHSGVWNADKTVRLPYIENARRPYKQLSLIEDSIVIYRLVRAPERLVFKVDVGNMNVPETEAYMSRLMHSFWSKKTFDFSGTGLQNSYNPQSMLDSFWFPVRNGQSGTEVTTLPGGQNLGQLDDLMYFVKKLYRSLKIPVSRLDPADPFKDGTEITREELKFAQFITRIQREFSTGLKRAFITHLKLREMWDEHELSEYDIHILFSTPTSFGVMREQQVFNIKYDNYNNMSQNEGISNSFAQRYYLGYDDAQMAENREWLRKDAAFQWELENLRSYGPNYEEAMEGEGMEGEGDMGGGGGGGSAEIPPDFGPGPDVNAGEEAPEAGAEAQPAQAPQQGQ